MINHLLKGGLCVAVAAAGYFASPAHASAPCWNSEQIAAAKVRDLQSRLMVATMRCSAMGINILPEYNQFVRNNRSTIQAANGVIKAQFARVSRGDGEAAYDRFTTALANAYGADPTNRSICRDTADHANAAADANGNREALLRIAEAMGSSPSLPGGECGVNFAEARR